MDWHVKGQGAANIVFSYCGDDPSLQGQVLRIRKASAHVASPVDQLIWSGALSVADGNCMQRELAYISELMAPLLGHQYVYAGVPCRVPEGLYGDIGGSEVCGDFPALLQPDHTTFHASSYPRGYAGVGPAICLEIKPKWGLRPDGCSVEPRQPWPPLECPATAASSSAAAAGAGTVTFAAPGNTDAEETATVEDPKVTLDSGLDYRRRYPRFLLHMLYKHVKAGAPMSHYNPLDLFSGDTEHMSRALRCLVESPSNNLRMFKEGVQVYGAAGAAGHCHSSIDQESLTTSSLQELAAHLRALVHDSVPVVVQAAQPNSVAADGAVHSDAETSTASALSTTDAGLGLSPTGADAAEPKPAGSEGILETVVRLAVLVLQREGVLHRLHTVQALDTVGPEGALRVYEEVAAALQGAVECGSLTLHLAVLRHYLMSATAKDCGIMVTLQRVRMVEARSASISTTLAQGATQLTRPTCILMNTAQQEGLVITQREVPGQLDASLRQLPSREVPELQTLVSGQELKQSSIWLMEDAASGHSYIYKVAFVDLDIKAAAKINKHFELEQRLVRCAAENSKLLQQLAACAGWMC